MIEVEQVGPPVTKHGEGPVWDDESGRLLFVDIPAGDVLTWDPAGAAAPQRHHVGPSVGAVRRRNGGGWVAGVETGFALVDGEGTVATLEPLWDDDAGVRMNDGTCDPAGRFWCGSMAYDEAAGRGELWRLDPGGDTTRVLTGVTISNGIVFSSDAARAFYVDSPTRRVDVLHLDDGAVVGREPWAAVEVDDGVPDGICRDAEGGLWVAVHGAGAVVRLDDQGRLNELVRLPVRRPTACAFGGERLDVLYVTTSAVDAPDDERTTAGALFALRPGLQGVQAYRFAG